MQNDPYAAKAAQLLKFGLMPSPDELRAGKVSKYAVLSIIFFLTDWIQGYYEHRYQHERCVEEYQILSWGTNVTYQRCTIFFR